jgi:hypothetical protein
MRAWQTTDRARLLAAAVVATTAALTAPRVHAQTWVGPGAGNFSGNFLTASNWNPAAVPQPTSTATFALNQNYTVTFSTNVVNTTLNFSNTTGLTTIGGTGITRTYTLLTSAVFSGGGTTVLGGLNLNALGTLSVRSGNLFRVLSNSTLTAANLQLADAGNGTSATISVEGDAAEFDVNGAGFHSVGRFGDTGTLTYSNLSRGSIAGTLQLGDSSSGAGAKGFLNALSGADVTILGDVRGATSALATQTAGITVQGASSSLVVTNGGSILLGASSLSKATFDILSGGGVNLMPGATLTLNPTATMTVNNATFLAAGAIDVGGLLTVTNGASFSHTGTASLRIGTGFGGVNTVNVGGAIATTSFAANNVLLGAIVAGTFNQSGGTVTLSGSTRLGSSNTGTFNLTGGLLKTNELFIADLDTNGAFTQSGGTHTVNALLRVAANKGGSSGAPLGTPDGSSTGAYTLSGGALAASTVWVGNTSHGVVNHSGGSMTVSNELTLGGIQEGNTILFSGSTVTGTYNLSASGSISADVERVGWTAAGTFTQTGGSNAVSSQLIVGDGGTSTGLYTLAGGTLTARLATVGNFGKGTFTQTGGTFTVTQLFKGGLTIGNSASSSTATYNLTGATAALNVATTLTVGNASTGVFNHTAGVNTTGTLVVGVDANGSYTIDGSATLNATNVQVGPSPGGSFGSVGIGAFQHQGSATVNISGNLNIATAGGQGEYDFNGGTLSAGGVSIGASARGEYFQVGGTATAQVFTVGAGFGTNTADVALDGGTLHVTGSEIVGSQTNAFFRQFGGLHQSDGSIRIGGDGSSFNRGLGTYEFFDGTLVTPRIDVTPLGTLAVGGSTNVVRIDNVALNVMGTFRTAGGDVAISGNATFGPTSTNTIVDRLNFSGTLTLQDAIIGGVGILTTDAVSRLTGSGAITASVNSGGILEASAGSLVVRGFALNNTGTLRNAVGATLFLKPSSFTNAGSVQVSGGGSVVFDQPLPIPAGKSLTLAGGTLGTPRLTNATGGTVSGFGQITGDVDNAGTITFIGPTQIVGNFTNRAGATLTVRNDQTLITGQSVNNGTITTLNGKVIFDGGLLPAAVPGAPLAAAASTGGGIDGSGSMSLIGASTLVASYVRQQSLTLSGTAAMPAVVSLRPKAFGGQTSVLNTLTIPASGGTMLGRLDLADTALLIDYPAGPGNTPLAFVRAAITSGNHGGDWTGNGITSSSAAVNTLTALGYAESADVLTFTAGAASFQGQSADASSVLVRYTLAGDANLDGVVDFLDLARLAQSYNVTDGARQWPQGDFNYDGNTDFLDLARLAQNYNTALPDAPIPGATPDFQRDLAAAFAAVPEPAALPAILLTGALVTCRRRRTTPAPTSAPPTRSSPPLPHLPTPPS